MMYIKTDIVPNETKRVFIVHGICEHSGRYDYFTRRLNDANISVIRYDLRGHGKSQGKRGYIKSFIEHIDDLRGVINKHINKNVKNVLFGHSMGGLLGHLYMVSNPKVDYYIASGAPTDYLKDVRLLRVLGYKWLGWIKITNKFDGKLSRVSEVEESYVNDSLNLRKYYIRLAGEMFVSGVKYLNENLYKHKAPTLILHGAEDKIVPKEMSMRMYEYLQSKDKTLKLYEGAYHEILNEINKEEVIDDIIGWLNER
ncbi:MAG: alpha/beta hydrolase [Acholeplasmataceae bacterium]|nr:alpha/beta hydrolase [Acholeplasmataceae bacterium]